MIGSWLVIFVPLQILGGLVFVYHRWIRPPEPLTDAQDFRPFESCDALLAERVRQARSIV